MKTERVLLVADTHGHLDRRLAALVAEHDCVVHAGDIGSRAVMEGLRPPSGCLWAVRGNNDTERQWPEAEGALPADLELALPGGTLWVEHGHRVNPARRRHERLRRRHPTARAILLGHSHQLLCDTTVRPWVLNPGAAGRSRTYGGPSCISLRAGEACWEVTLMRFARSRGDTPVERQTYTLEFCDL